MSKGEKERKRVLKFLPSITNGEFVGNMFVIDVKGVVFMLVVNAKV